VIYLDTAVVLSQLLAEDRKPSASLGDRPLVSSRLLQYEVWVRLHARRLARSHGEAARELLERISLLELAPEVLARVLDPFPVPVRPLDAIHLASAEFLSSHHQPIELATFDERMGTAARALAIPLAQF
jgi:predicted nucleic acid-binding protein